MILLGVGAEMLARLMQADRRGPDTAWLLAGPTDETVVETPPKPAQDWPVAAE